LFERLSEIGHHKDLLDVQYRMHPCISKFPNENFYDNKIIDGPNVKEYHCTYLPGRIFGPYSFIHVEDGCEEHTGQGFRNFVEADVAANIICRLAKGIYLTFQLSDSK
jgi:senataxin